MIKLPETEGLHDKGRLGDPTGPGPRLRAAREACGYDIQDIAKQLRLHPHIIADLERDKFSDHLALVFVRGYLRAYAGLIGLDPDEVVAEFNALGYQEARDLPDLKNKSQAGSRMRNTQDMYKSRARSGVRWAAVAAITVALGGLFVAFNYQPQEQIYSAPVVSDVSEANAPAPGIDPNLPPAAPVDPNAPVTAPAAAAPVTTPAAAPAAPVPVPAAAAPASPRPVVRAPSATPPSEDDDEPQLPRPGSDD
jgi:cytoskeleton protein RodZ